MSTTLTITGITATACSIAFTNLPGGGTVEIQIADNPDFRGLVAINAYAATPAAIAGLNQRSSYYARGRTVTSGGVYGAWGATEGFRTSDGAAWDTAPQNILISPAILVCPEPILEMSANEVAGWPETNLLRDDPQLMWMVAQAGAGPYTATVHIRTLGQPIDTFALLGTNAPEASTLQIKGTTTMARALASDWDYSGAANAFRASANLPQRPSYHHLTRLVAPLNHKVWTLIISSANPFSMGRFQALYLAVGLARTAKNITTEKTETPLDLGSIDRTRSAGPNRVWGFKMRKADFEISVMYEMQWETQFADLWRKIGLSEPVLVVPNSRTGAFLHDRIMFGTVSQQRATNVNSPIFTQAFSVESLI